MAKKWPRAYERVRRQAIADYCFTIDMSKRSTNDEEARHLATMRAQSGQECAYCHDAAYSVVARLNDDVMIARCHGCGLARTLPYPIFDYEDNAAYASGYDTRERLFARFAHEFMQFVAAHATGPRLLDAGCGMGFLLEEAAARGFSARGIEVNRREVDMTRARGLDVRWGTLEATGLPSASVDVVCMSHVLEHVTDLRGALAEVHRVLRPGGILAVAQPYYGAPLPLLLPRHWYGWQPGQHVWHFDPPALERVLAACELQRIALAYNSMHHSWVTRPLSLRPKIATVQAAVAAVARIETRLGRGDQFYLAASAT